jgi:hypothetical protein
VGSSVTEKFNALEGRTFKQRAEKIGLPGGAYLLVTYGAVPGLEAFKTVDAKDIEDRQLLLEVKEFPAELVKQLQEGNAEGRTTAVRFLYMLATYIRSAAWMRSRDEGDKSFQTALGGYACSGPHFLDHGGS